MSKVFGIGLGRTGTRSLHQALLTLGYRSIHNPISMELIDQHEAASDTTVAVRFKELDRLYPGSKFILTVRDFETWAFSTICKMARRVKSLNEKPKDPAGKEFVLQARFAIYGSRSYSDCSVDVLRASWHRHHGSVYSYFGRDERLLVIRIVDGQGWETLCPFLGKDVPTEAFPYLNRVVEG